MARSPRNESRRRTSGSIGRQQGWFEQQQIAAVDSLLRLCSDPLGTLLAALVMGIALALPLTLFLLLQNLQGLGQDFGEAGAFSLYLQQDMEETQQRQLLAELQQRDDLVAVELITPAQALEEFETVSGFEQVLQGLQGNPLPPVLVVTPAALDTPALEALQQELGQLPGVDLVEFDLAWMQRLQAVVALAQRLALLLGGMLALGVLLVIGNTIRLAIESRRTEIVVVKLVGGTDAYVARPFLYAGLWYGAAGGLVAVVLAGSGIWALSGPYDRLLGSYGSTTQLQGLGLTGGFMVLAGAALLGWLGAQISVLRHLRAIEPR